MPTFKRGHFIAALCIVIISLKPAAAERQQQISHDLTEHVELVGNPLREKYPDGEWSYARNIWDMEVYGDRLYLGHGNSDNNYPAANAGPVDVWSFNALTGVFVNEFTVEEEQIERFRIIQDTLVIPGHDPTDGGSKGSLYYQAGDQWVRSQTIPNALHVYDIYRFEDRLFVGKSPEAAIAVSSSLEVGWIELQVFDDTLGPSAWNVSRVWEFFEIGDRLFLSVQMPVVLAVGTPQNTPAPIILAAPPVYFYEADGFSAAKADFFVGHDKLKYPLRVARSVEFMDRAIYIGAEVTSFHNWSPIGLFVADTSLQVSRFMLGHGSLPWDILLEDNVLYVLTATQNDRSQGTIVSVVATCDLRTWHEVLHFTANTFARSFMLYRGDFYFGLGTDADSLSSAAGDILRIKADNFDTSCP